ncbi:hypothetical protein [Marinobacterium sp. BA1]|uniref:hypothetical protein n=1 Tax=Marinobacterium sp. BA1 TaxID=3138931 RepID=UPI0032E7C220
MKKLVLASLLACPLMLNTAIATDEEYKGGPITESAIEYGATKCINQVRTVDKYINGTNPRNGAWTTAPKENTANRYYAFFNLKRFEDDTTGFAHGTVIPQPGNTGRCDVSMMHVVTFPNQSCISVRERFFKDYEYIGEVAGKPIYSKDMSKVALEDLTGSCVIVRSEVTNNLP